MKRKKYYTKSRSNGSKAQRRKFTNPQPIRQNILPNQKRSKLDSNTMLQLFGSILSLGSAIINNHAIVYRIAAFLLDLFKRRLGT